MKVLAVAGLAMLASVIPTQAQEKCGTWGAGGKFIPCEGQPQATPTGPRPPECSGYQQPPHCAQWNQPGQDGWQPGQPGQPPPGTGTWQPPPGQQPPPTTTTTRKCEPGYILMRYGNRWRCIRQRQETTQVPTPTPCQPGWIWSRRLYKCVPGYVGPGTSQDVPGRRVCGYGRVWSETEYRCVRFRTGGGTDGGYQCGPGERWSNSQYRCVPRRDRDRTSSGIYIDLGGIGISNRRRGDDDYRRRRGNDDYGNRGGGGDYGYRGSGGNDYRGRGR